MTGDTQPIWHDVSLIFAGLEYTLKPRDQNAK